MRAITIILIVCATKVVGQNNLVHFSLWKPKPGLEQNFEDGYKAHLKWHKENNDKWNWYGWYIISGPRIDYFLDASPGHNWSDFDSPVAPSGDSKDNALHTVPFGDFQTSYKALYVPGLSFS